MKWYNLTIEIETGWLAHDRATAIRESLDVANTAYPDGNATVTDCYRELDDLDEAPVPVEA